MRRHLLATISLGALLLTACGGGDPASDGDTDDPGTTTTATETPTGAPATTEDADDGPTEDAAGGGEVATASTDHGTVLVDGEGRTLYLFDNDSDGESSCYDDCAENWPPLTGEVTAAGDADASLLGTTERDDGTVQVTYAGHPLYYFAADTAPGDTNGQGVGGVWWVLGPDGERITEEAAAAEEVQPADAYDY